MALKKWFHDWINDPQQAKNGGIVRRSDSDVDKNGGIESVLEEARERGWHIIHTGDQYVILCHEGSLTILCWQPVWEPQGDNPAR